MINQKYHFDITPHIVKQLGEQLVSDEITALHGRLWRMSISGITAPLR